MGKNYWMVVQTRENFEISRKLGFTVHGLRKKQRRRADRMRPEDKVLFYVSDLRKWTVAATITSRYFEDRSSIWVPAPRGERFPFRVSLRPDITLDEESYVDGLQLGPRLEYVKRWAPEDWPLAFVDTLHLIPQRDYRLIEGEMRRITRASRNSSGNGRRRPDKVSPDTGPPITDTNDDLLAIDERTDGAILGVETVAASDQEAVSRNGPLADRPDIPGDAVDSPDASEGRAAEGPDEESTQVTTTETEDGQDSSDDTNEAADSPDTPEIRASEILDGEPTQATTSEADERPTSRPDGPGDPAEATDSPAAPENHAADGSGESSATDREVSRDANEGQLQGDPSTGSG